MLGRLPGTGLSLAEVTEVSTKVGLDDSPVIGMTCAEAFDTLLYLLRAVCARDMPLLIIAEEAIDSSAVSKDPPLRCPLSLRDSLLKLKLLGDGERLPNDGPAFSPTTIFVSLETCGIEGGAESGANLCVMDGGRTTDIKDFSLSFIRNGAGSGRSSASLQGELPPLWQSSLKDSALIHPGGVVVEAAVKDISFFGRLGDIFAT
mmetsp:Transcript_51283/g.115517  ORF Transcript_51283/g.115517 Transcript_51283/m.115517 type:complete len:204 (-) Transcript_51283:215-826(-)